jgi:hypothetical protein
MCLESKQPTMLCILQLNFDSAAAEKSTLQMGRKNIYPDFAAKPLLLHPCWSFLTETAWRSRIYTFKTEL